MCLIGINIFSISTHTFKKLLSKFYSWHVHGWGYRSTCITDGQRHHRVYIKNFVSENCLKIMTDHDRKTWVPHWWFSSLPSAEILSEYLMVWILSSYCGRLPTSQNTRSRKQRSFCATIEAKGLVVHERKILSVVFRFFIILDYVMNLAM